MDTEYLSVEEIKNLLNHTIAGFRAAASDDEEFLPKYKKLGIVPDMSKYLDAEEQNNEITIFCDIPGCKEDFHGVSAYKSHYNRVHRHLCIACKSSLPTAHLLDLHLCETHDTYFATLVEHGKARYQCFVEECAELFVTTEARKEHAIKVHKLPQDFRFGLLDGNTKNKTKKKPKVKGKPQQAETEQMEVDVDQQQATSTTKKLEKGKCTKSFSFGHTKEKMFNAKSNKALENMKDMKDALDEL